MMMLQCSAAHFTTNSFSYRIKNLIVPFTIRQILQVCICIRCVLSVSTLGYEYTCYSDIIGEPWILCALIGYLRKNKSSHMNEKIIRLQVVQKHFTFYPNSKRVQEGEVRRNQTATVPKDTSRVL